MNANYLLNGAMIILPLSVFLLASLKVIYDIRKEFNKRFEKPKWEK